MPHPSLTVQVKNRLLDQFSELENASAFHKKVQALLATTLPFKNFHCYQEVNVRDLIPDYPNGSHHYDWYIDELSMVIEVHGRQHYVPTAYGKISYDLKQRNFNRQLDRDNSKKYYAEANGLEYREIPYTVYKKLDAKLLKSILFKESS